MPTILKFQKPAKSPKRPLQIASRRTTTSSIHTIRLQYGTRLRKVVNVDKFESNKRYTIVNNCSILPCPLTLTSPKDLQLSRQEIWSESTPIAYFLAAIHRPPLEDLLRRMRSIPTTHTADLLLHHQVCIQKAPTRDLLQLLLQLLL